MMTAVSAAPARAAAPAAGVTGGRRRRPVGFPPAARRLADLIRLWRRCRAERSDNLDLIHERSPDRCARGLFREAGASFHADAASAYGKNVGDDFREGKITLPVVLAFRRGSDAEREFWRRTLERGEANDADLEHAIGLMAKHRALEDTIGRAHHYGAIARDALALFPDSPMKSALAETVDFCIARTH